MRLDEVLDSREKAKDIVLVKKLRAKRFNPVPSKTRKIDTGGDTTGGMAGTYGQDNLFGDY